MRKVTAAMFVLAFTLFSVGAEAQTRSVNQPLTAGQELFSANQAYKLVLQATDGNLVVYRVSDMKPIWATNALGGKMAVLQLDRNFVVYKDTLGVPANAVWNSHTDTSVVDPNSLLWLKDDGSLAIWSGSGSIIWSTPADPAKVCAYGSLDLYPVCAYGYTTRVPACNWADAQTTASQMGGYAGACR